LMKEIFHTCIEAAEIWYDKDADYWSAVISYYTLFAITPLLLITTVLIGTFFGEELVGSVLAGWGNILGESVIDLLKAAIINLRELTEHFNVPIVGIVFFSGIIIFGFNAFTSALHALWGIPHNGFHGWIKKCFRSFVFFIFLQIYVAFFIGIEAGLFTVAARFHSENILVSGLLIVLATGVTLILHTLLFAAAFSTLPVNSPPLRSIFYGALLTAFFFLIGKYLVSFYVVRTPIPALYEGAGRIIVLLIWVFASAAIVFYGAAFSFAHSKRTLRKEQSY
jgi:membrane protein